jgi:hypothetical protein
MSALDEIRGRREATTEQYLGVLDMLDGDTGNKRSLLVIAARGLGDGKVAAKWIEKAAAEEDTQLKAEMVGRILELDARKLDDPKPYLQLLLDALMLDAVKGPAIGSLSRLLAGQAWAVQELIEAYQHQGRTSIQREILRALVKLEIPPPPVVQFFLSILDKVDPDAKAAIVDRLAKRDAIKGDVLLKLLAPDEPDWVKLRALRYVIDRSVAADDAVIRVLQKDGSAEVRLFAVQALAARGTKSKPAIEALAEALRKDPDPRVRQEAMLSFRHSMEMSAEALAALMGALRSETTLAGAQTTLALLIPHVNRSFPVRDALLAFLKENPKAEIAVAIYDAIGALTTWDPGLFEMLFKAFEVEKQDRIKASILKALSSWHEPDDKLIALYVSMLKSPDAKIRTWAARGLILLPLTEGIAETVALGAEILLDEGVDWDVRHELAKKIAIIPTYSPAALAALKKGAEQGTDEIKTLCEKAWERGKSQAPEGPQIDWDLWYKRVEVEKRCEGIFPDLFVHYGSNPVMGKKILKAALNPEVNLYQVHGYDVGTMTIVRYLTLKNAVDDDIARYCLRWMLEKGSEYGAPTTLLNAFKSHPTLPELKDGLWKVLEKRTDGPWVLFREVLEAVYGSEEAAGREFRSRVLAKTSAAAAANYLQFLEKNVAWGPTPSILEELAKKKLDDRKVEELFKKIGRDVPKAAAPPPKPETPGFADE